MVLVSFVFAELNGSSFVCFTELSGSGFVLQS